MISCGWLERPGAWRIVGAVLLLGLAVAPTLPILIDAVTAEAVDGPGKGFVAGLRNSAIVALLVAVTSFLLGLPAGVLAALYEFPGRRLLIPLAILPLLVPSFLWAIGWSMLAGRLGPDVRPLLASHGGCALVFLAGAFPLVFLTTLAATRSLSGSQVDAARLAGGECAVFANACRHAAPAAVLAAVLAGVLTLPDPGPGMTFGRKSAAGEILTSFNLDRYSGVVGLQCLILSAWVVVATIPLTCLIAPRLASELLARQTKELRRTQHSWSALFGAGGLGAMIIIGVVLPLTGLVLPLLRASDWAQAQKVVDRTWLDTLLYAIGAGAEATVLGFTLAGCVGRSRRLRIIALSSCAVLFALPPSLGAIGVVRVGAATPHALDLIFHSTFTVSATLGLRLIPVAVLLGLRAWASMPATWAQVGAIHGIPLWRYLGRVVVPHLLPSAIVSMVLVGLLATADVGTVLLVYPPGNDSLPLAVFTVMSNAPEALVASLCLLYIGLAGALLVLVWTLAGRTGT